MALNVISGLVQVNSRDSGRYHWPPGVGVQTSLITPAPKQTRRIPKGMLGNGKHEGGRTPEVSPGTVPYDSVGNIAETNTFLSKRGNAL